MKKLFASVVICAAIAAQAVEVDGIAANVGAVSILRSDVYAEMARYGVRDDSRFNEFRNKLIERELILKAALAAKMTMQDWVVEDRIRTIVEESFGGDRTKLETMLIERKISEADWRNRIKDDMIVAAMRWNCVDKNVQVSPAKMAEEYKKNKDRYAIGKRVTLSVILLSPENIEKKSEITKLLATSSFADVAKKYSADKRASEGGLWKDVVPEEEFTAQVCAEIEATPIGTISKWVDMDGWSFLLRKEGESSAGARSFVEAYEDIQANVREAETKRLYDEWIDRLKAGTYIKTF